MLLEQLVARFGPAGPVDVRDRPHAHGLEHAVLLDDGLAAAVGQASLAAGEQVVGGGQVGDVARSPGEELEVDPPHLLPVLHAAPGILAGGGADVEAAGRRCCPPSTSGPRWRRRRPTAGASRPRRSPVRRRLPGRPRAAAPGSPARTPRRRARRTQVTCFCSPAARRTFSRKTSRRVSAARISSPTSVPSIAAAVGLTSEVSTVTCSCGLVANLRGRDLQHARSVEHRDGDLGLVQIHDRRDALGRRVPLEDHFRAVGLGGPRHVEGQGDRRVALRLEVDAIDAGLAVEGPLPGLLVVGDQGQHESRRQGRQVLGPQPEGEQDLPAHLHPRRR